jgi:hypothetical protein
MIRAPVAAVPARNERREMDVSIAFMAGISLWTF